MAIFDVVSSSLINEKVVPNAFGIAGLFLSMIEAGKLFLL